MLKCRTTTLLLFMLQITGVKETATSKVRLLSSTGRVVSQKMEELYAMLDHLNINASNPLAVMTQVITHMQTCLAWQLLPRMLLKLCEWLLALEGSCMSHTVAVCAMCSTSPCTQALMVSVLLC